MVSFSLQCSLLFLKRNSSCIPPVQSLVVSFSPQVVALQVCQVRTGFMNMPKGREDKYINNKEDNEHDSEIPNLGLPYPCGQLAYVKPRVTAGSPREKKVVYQLSYRILSETAAAVIDNTSR